MLFEPHLLGEQTLETYLFNLDEVKDNSAQAHYQLSSLCHRLTCGSMRCEDQTWDQSYVGRSPYRLTVLQLKKRLVTFAI